MSNEATIKILYDRGLKIENLDEENNKFIRVYDRTNGEEILDRTPFDKIVNVDRTYFMDNAFAIEDKDGHTKLFKGNPKQDVFIEIHSQALGDQIAWMPICDLFQKKYNCKVQVGCKFPELFKPFYPNLEIRRTYFKGETPEEGSIKFIDRYILGYAVNGFTNKDGLIVSPTDCRSIGLQEVACKELGLPMQEVRPEYKSNIIEPIIKGKYVVLTTCGAGDFKFWHYKNGWKEIVKYFKKKGLKVVHVGKTPYTLKDTINKKGTLEWNKMMNILQYSELFLGLASGLSWLAHHCGAKVVTIDGITQDFAYFKCTKVQNKEVCNGCWNDLSFEYTGQANYCPRNKDYECTKMITPEMVIKEIEKI